MRRIVTGHRNGKSVIVDDTEIPSTEIPTSDFIGGLKVTHFWEIDGTPTIPIAEGELKKKLPLKLLEPGRIRVALSWLPPDKEVFISDREQNVDPQKALA